ncbi:Probable magnesium transporter NIPA9 [Prunus dulcis]|uniref:Probable magnesium transporter n=1 Tax=Prunus dulcis TaxID=3755 RepID=A0A4Y1QT91_PRUDU|nr:Probable magnesium transporter NIPA9 [Prunus dulcis]
MKRGIMWESIFLTLRDAGNNIGKILQKKGTVILPPLSFKLKGVCFEQSLVDRFSDGYIWSLAHVESIISCSCIGTIGVGAGGEEQKASAISIFHLPWLAIVVAILFVLLNGWLRIYRRQRKEQELCLSIVPSAHSHLLVVQMEYDVVEEIIYGLESGILFGMASVISKMGFVFLEQGFPSMLVPICLIFSICCSGTGFFYQTWGLKHGRAIVVSTCAAVASIVTGVLAGMLALGERLPSAPTARLSLVLGWLFIIFGVILLVSSTRLVRNLPRPLRHFIQSGVDKNFSQRKSGSIRTRDSSPSTVIQAATLHHLIPTSSKEKA